MIDSISQWKWYFDCQNANDCAFIFNKMSELYSMIIIQVVWNILIQEQVINNENKIKYSPKFWQYQYYYGDYICLSLTETTSPLTLQFLLSFTVYSQ